MVMPIDKETLSKLVKQFPATGELSTSLKSYLQSKAAECISKTGSFVVGLSGGSLINVLAPHITELVTPEWFCFLVDERFVPETSTESNAGQWLSAGLPDDYLHRRTQRDATSSPVALEAAAVAAEDALKWVLEETGKDGADLILLGMGADGHTASLFPTSQHYTDRSLQYSRLYVAVSDAPSGPPQRLSMTLAAINASKEVIFVVSGEFKADALRRVLVLHDKKLPAYHVKPDKLTWYVDNNAAGKLFIPISPSEVSSHASTPSPARFLN
jgi:6-phosphogluconolactonase